MTKLKLPKQVAEALDNLLAKHQGYLVYECVIVRTTEDPRDDDNLRIVADHVSRPDLMKAIVNGYEAEVSPEEEVLEYYKQLQSSEVGEVFNGSSGSQFRQGWKSIEKTLDILGIKIEGVNA